MATLSSSLQEVTQKQSGVCSVQYLLERVGEVHAHFQGSSATQQAADQDCTLGFQLHSGVIQVFSFLRWPLYGLLKSSVLDIYRFVGLILRSYCVVA